MAVRSRSGLPVRSSSAAVGTSPARWCSRRCWPQRPGRSGSPTRSRCAPAAPPDRASSCCARSRASPVRSTSTSSSSRVSTTAPHIRGCGAILPAASAPSRETMASSSMSASAWTSMPAVIASSVAAAYAMVMCSRSRWSPRRRTCSILRPVPHRRSASCCPRPSPGGSGGRHTPTLAGRTARTSSGRRWCSSRCAADRPVRSSQRRPRRCPRSPAAPPTGTTGTAGCVTQLSRSRRSPTWVTTRSRRVSATSSCGRRPGAVTSSRSCTAPTASVGSPRSSSI